MAPVDPGPGPAAAPRVPAERVTALRLLAGLLVLPAALLLADLGLRSPDAGGPRGRLDQIALFGLGAWTLAGTVVILALPRMGGRAAARLLLAATSMVATLAAAEFGLRISLADRLHRPYARRPHLRFVTRPAAALPGIHGESVYTTNALGLRGRMPVPEDEIRILTVGGSTTECLYLDDSEDWSALLERRLSEGTGRRVWVGNAGAAGFHTLDHVRTVGTLPEAGQADWIVVLCGWNDLCRHLAGTWKDADGEAEGRAIFRYGAPPGAPWLQRLLLFSRLREAVRRAGVVGAADRVAEQDPQADWVERRRRIRASLPRSDHLPELSGPCRDYAGRLRDIVEAARRRGARVLLLTQPTLYARDMAPGLEALTYAFEFPRFGYALTPEAIVEALDAFNATMMEVAREMDVPCVPLHERVPATTEAFYDDCHFNEGGARIVAEVVAEALVPLIRDASPSSVK